MKYHITTFGCQMNKSDSERIAAVLEKMGYKKSPTLAGADLVVINMCSVRQAAVDKCKNQISKCKMKNENAKIILTGCILKNDKTDFFKTVDYILDIKMLNHWPRFLKKLKAQLSEDRPPKVEACEVKQQRLEQACDYLKIKPKYGDKKIAYVPVSYGCNNFCSYCVVPYTRGKETHRPKNEIFKEIRTLVKQRYKRIILLGENVNNYPHFTDLLRKITAIKGNFTVSFLAANPHNFTDGLIDEIVKNPKLEKYIHLPLQSGDNTILKKMKRPYTREQYLKLVAKIQKKIPGVKIAADIIVGFPGETKKQFQNTVNVMNKACFTQAYIAKYSPRTGTSAYKLKDNVPAEEKSRREQKLRIILKAGVSTS